MDERVRRTVETYERVADTYEEIHGDRSVVADIVEQFVTAVGRADTWTRADGSDSTGPPRVLDVGCGPGWESAAFAEAGFEVVPFDLTRSFLGQARERVPEATPVRGDMRALPFADGGFDGLWACASLLHVPEREVPGTLAEFERALADGGVTVVSLKAAGTDDEAAAGTAGGGDRAGVDRSPYDDDRRHFERYGPDRVRELFANAGFEVVSVETDDGDGTGSEDAWVAVTARAGD
ncbi:class I SAM-dependent methyltransferase [Halosimplex halophilum]|uniref:class I SAM-dependent methyltransferase n=1 Tax=Halosimplex halophilum TaxID=2559572 RepID=UPI00107EF60B|nr:class I SAM-dependent methyltransferase [Halosimplex halophilum]